jgi:hypothetical protein
VFVICSLSAALPLSQPAPTTEDEGFSLFGPNNILRSLLID